MQPITLFSKCKRLKDGVRPECKSCQATDAITYRVKNDSVEFRSKRCKTVKKYNAKNKDKKSKYNKSYYNDHKEIIIKQKNTLAKEKRKINPNFKIRGIISNTINQCLKQSNGSKNNQSCLKFLEYSIKELKEHLESQFEPWMSWSNHGRYNLETWKNEDQSTWVWNIDHIIPQSDLKYTSMTDDNFNKCWALENLRPLSAKQNILDGVNKTRHNNVYMNGVNIT